MLVIPIKKSEKTKIRVEDISVGIYPIPEFVEMISNGIYGQYSNCRFAIKYRKTGMVTMVSQSNLGHYKNFADVVITPLTFKL